MDEDLNKLSILLLHIFIQYVTICLQIYLFHIDSNSVNLYKTQINRIEW